MATITADGFTRVEEPEIEQRFRALVDTLSTPEGTSADSAPSPVIGGPR
jgi:hypothetical protein